MASLIPGFEYDIFISYRQKDNKGDNWVTKFVEALKTELDSTFKEDISVYFDINPHDGLLETHDVDESLKDKLKCLIFIPVISKTYCDPKSFAWEHEFKTFIGIASHDQFGLKVNLRSGNVGNRVLPVRIHDLDHDDIKQCESLLGGVIRGVDFVYKSPGVNRPLRVNEDHPHDNLTKTYYRDQVNKVANAIDEIIHSLRYGNAEPREKSTKEERDFFNDKKKKRNYLKKISSGENKFRSFFLLIASIIFLAGMYLFIRVYHFNNTEKTIAIIPLTNPPNDIELGKLAIGSMDAIITKLQEIKSLTVRGRLSCLQYLDTKKTLSELRKDLRVNYLVEISISRTAKNPNMWIGLTKTKNDKELWASQFDIQEGQLMPLFTKIVQTLAGKLDIKFSGEEISNIERDLTKNPDAYLNYLSASAKLYSAMGNKFPDSVRFTQAIRLYDKAIGYDPDFASAYARRAIARSWGIHTGEINMTNCDLCWKDIASATRLNKELTDVQIALGFYYYYCRKDYVNSLISFNTADIKDPENYQPSFYMAMVYRAMGDWEKVHQLINRVIKFNLQEPLYLTNIGISFDYLHNFDSALIFHQKAINSDPAWSASYNNKIESLCSKYGNTSGARSLLDSAIRNTNKNFNNTKIDLDIYDGKYSEAFAEAIKSDPDDFGVRGERYLCLANICSLLNKKEDALKYYDSALVDLNNEMTTYNDDSYIHSLIGLGYAGVGNKVKAIEEGKKAIDLTIADKNKMKESDMIVTLAQIYTRLGLFDEAIKNVEFLLKNPSNFSTKILKLDPVWKPLFNYPEMKTLIMTYSQK
jgi:tetratricopeptide (TPR) repeat protein/TolB-like protein